MLDLELALLRRGLDERLAGSERCTCCHRTPLVGERVYVYASGTIACELCRRDQRVVLLRILSGDHDAMLHRSILFTSIHHTSPANPSSPCRAIAITLIETQVARKRDIPHVGDAKTGDERRGIHPAKERLRTTAVVARVRAVIRRHISQTLPTSKPASR